MDEIRNNGTTERAVLAGVIRNTEDEESLDELQELAVTAGAEVVGIVTQRRDNINTAHYIGKGKLEELKLFVEDREADLVITDDELTGTQIKNIEDYVNVRVIDRTSLILDIFAGRARTRESMLQVELAQLRYRLPRLTGLGTQLSRLGGGIGTRGPGETKLESDRRHIQNRIRAIERKMKEIERHRSLYRERRKKNQVPVVAVVGYTNAGKSTLLNALAEADAYVEDKLFATLDPSARRLVLPSGRELVLVDTVGFIRKLPHDLVEAFKSTLEEVKYADLILHVIDAASPDMEEKVRVVERVLTDLGAVNSPKINVYNKIDLVDVVPTVNGRGVYISAKDKTGLDMLMQEIEKTVFSDVKIVTLLLPYDKPKEYSYLKEKANILEEAYEARGILVKAEVGKEMMDRIREYIISVYA